MRVLVAHVMNDKALNSHTECRFLSLTKKSFDDGELRFESVINSFYFHLAVIRFMKYEYTFARSAS